MKGHMFLVLSAITSSAFAAPATESPIVVDIPVAVPVHVTKVEAQSPVRANTNVKVTLHVNLPNGCHTLGRSDVAVDKIRERVEIEPIAFFHTNRICAQQIVEAKEVVVLGQLQPGSYQVEVQGSQTETVTTIEVLPALNTR